MPSKIIEAEHKLDEILSARSGRGRLPDGSIATAIAWSDAVWGEAIEFGPLPLSDADIVSGKQLALHPLFICGVHRSGTTLMQNLLDGHPDLAVLPSEGTYFTNLEVKLNSRPESERMVFLGKEWLRRLANPTNHPPYWLLGRSIDDSSPYIDFARYFMAWWNVLQQKAGTQWPHVAVVLAYASATGKINAKLWVDKTPVNERYLERIWREIPGAKIIHMIRDPFATLASRKVMEPAISVRNALRDLKLSYNAAVACSVRSQYMLLHYETLCDEPAETMGSVASFLGIRPLPILNRATVADIPAQANSSFDNGKAEAGQILRPRKQTRTEVLAKTEKQLIAAHIGNLAAKLNYPMERIKTIRKYYLLLKNRLL